MSNEDEIKLVAGLLVAVVTIALVRGVHDDLLTDLLTHFDTRVEPLR